MIIIDSYFLPSYHYYLDSTYSTILTEFCTVLLPNHARLRFKKKSVRKIVKKRVARAIEKDEKTRADSTMLVDLDQQILKGTIAPDVQGYDKIPWRNVKSYDDTVYCPAMNPMDGARALDLTFRKRRHRDIQQIASRTV
ncbi:hypothetical protein Tco_0909178 [Tanacetum coccineum]|uniref:Uncharacterized protein n=1 Tax=Tanacetum coccineum TaxID=301880 RepID=A0ABQ5CSL4_9ASTR